jgi:hypothetical protein
MYVPNLMLMALHEERVRDFDRRAFHARLHSQEVGQARSSRARPWPARAFAALAALSGRSHAGARRGGLAAVRAHS